MTEFTFEETPWEQALASLEEDTQVSGAQLLQLLEGASEAEIQDALAYLAQKHVALDMENFPVLPSGGATAQRLKLEQELVEKNISFEGLEGNDPLRLYMEELASVPVAGDVNLIALDLAEGKSGAREQLMPLMLGRAVALAKEYVGKGVLLTDLIQEASLGLWEATDNYRGGDIEQYCDWWMRQYMAGAVIQQASALGMGQKLRQAMDDYRTVDERLLTELGRNPTEEELAEAMHISLQEVRAVASMVANARAMNRVHQPEPEELPQEEDQAVEDTAYFQMRSRVQELLSGLSPEDAKLLTLRYGLEGGQPLDPAQVAVKLGIPANEVIKREAAALAKLRQ